MSGPSVSVILPVYNGERHLRIAIESVLAQTLRDFELIIVDDGSDHEISLQVIEDSRIKYVRQENTRTTMIRRTISRYLTRALAVGRLILTLI